MKLVMVHSPFSAPTAPPYALSYLKSFVRDNVDCNIVCLDLNAKLHRSLFAEYYDQLGKEEYGKLLTKFHAETKETISGNTKKVVDGELPELFQEMLDEVLAEKPDVVAFSLVYNSQCFYAKPLIAELEKKGIKCIVGGPAVNDKIGGLILKNEIELVEFLVEEDGEKTYSGDHCNCDTIPDFSDYDRSDYFSLDFVVPIRTSSTCPYKRCAFCTHYSGAPYFEFSLENIRETIVGSGAKHVIFIDDMITKKRLLELAKILKPLEVKWWCQLRPTADLLGVFDELYSAGLRCVSWGVESGNQRVLDLMRKGTKVGAIQKVLEESHSAGILNSVYIIFGFPGERKEEFVDTIEFLKKNDENIDLISTSIFGLQKGSAVYKEPDAFGIDNINEEKRTVLGEKITYSVKEGLSAEEANDLRDKYIKTIKNIDKLPRVLNWYKEQIICFGKA